MLYDEVNKNSNIEVDDINFDYYTEAEKNVNILLRIDDMNLLKNTSIEKLYHIPVTLK